MDKIKTVINEKNLLEENHYFGHYSAIYLSLSYAQVFSLNVAKIRVFGKNLIQAVSFRENHWM